jgi:hypothetical protein
MQTWKVFEAKGLDDSSQCEDMLNFNALTYKANFDKIQNDCNSAI